MENAIFWGQLVGFRVALRLLKNRKFNAKQNALSSVGVGASIWSFVYSLLPQEGYKGESFYGIITSLYKRDKEK
jgi:hypothetical protein